MTTFKPAVRRQSVQVLRGMAEIIRYTTHHWHKSTQVFDESLSYPWRKARPAELPENKIHEWEKLYRDMGEIITAAEALQQRATEAIRILRAGA